MKDTLERIETYPYIVENVLISVINKVVLWCFFICTVSDFQPFGARNVLQKTRTQQLAKGCGILLRRRRRQGEKKEELFLERSFHPPPVQ